MKGYYQQVIDYLRAAGWTYKGPAKGSHEKWIKGDRQVLVPFNCISRHTANGVTKSAGLGKKF